MIEDAGRLDGSTLLWPDRACFHDAGPYELVEESVLGERMSVFRHRPENMRALVESAASFGDRDAFVFDDTRITFSGYERQVAATALALAERYGIGPGDRVALLGSNTPGWVVAFSAVTSLGAVVVGLNGWWVESEIRYGIELTHPKLVLADRRRLARIPEFAAGDVVVRELESEIEESVRAGSDAPLPDASIAEDDPAVILFTSGTTGRPKGAVHSHRNLMVLASCTAQVAGDAAAAMPPSAERDDSPCSLYLLPLFHVSGLHGGLVHTLMLGWKSVWVPGRFDEARVFELTERERVTTWSVVPAQLFRLLEHPAFSDFDLSSLGSVGGGGSAWPASLSELVNDRLPAAAASMSFGFGQTESSGMGTANSGPPLLACPESAGRPRPTSEIQIRNESDESCREGKEGEICIRGPGVFLGYWEDPDATDAVMSPGRWLHTGDIGTIREGLLHVAGRRSDLIIRGGENIYPAEIEACLLEHPNVLEAAVFGIDDRVLGQEVKAVVRQQDDESLDESTLREWLAERLARFKIPAYVEMVSEPLPRNVTGKVLKHVLKEGVENIFDSS